jgi:hypothetical protein
MTGWLVESKPGKFDTQALQTVQEDTFGIDPDCPAHPQAIGNTTVSSGKQNREFAGQYDSDRAEKAGSVTRSVGPPVHCTGPPVL